MRVPVSILARRPVIVLSVILLFINKFEPNQLSAMTQHKFNSGYIIAISFISALGGYLFGFDFAVISGALPFLRTTFGLTPWLEGFLTGSLALGCIVGCLIAGALAEKFGRRPGLMTAAIVFALSSIGMALSGSLTVFI